MAEEIPKTPDGDIPRPKLARKKPARQMRGFKEQFNIAIEIAKEKFVSFLIVGIIGVVLQAIAGMIWLKILAPLSSSSVLMMLITIAIGFLFTAFPMVLMFTAFFMLITGKSSSPLEAYKDSFPKLLGMVLIFVIMTLAQNGGFILLIIPGVIVFVWFYFVFFVYVKENLSPIDSFVQSREYARGNFAIIFIRLLLALLICFLLLIPPAILVMIPGIGVLLMMLAASMIGVLFFSYGYVLYEELAALCPVRADTLDKGQKMKSLALPILTTVVALTFVSVSATKRMLQFRKLPLGNMLKIMMSGDMSRADVNKAMNEAMKKQLQQLASKKNASPEVQEMLAQMLGEKGAEKAQAKTQSAINPPKREETKLEKTSEESKEIRKLFSEFLTDSDWRIRKEAVIVLGEMGWQEFLPELKRMTKDPNNDVRREASKSIILIYSKNEK